MSWHFSRALVEVSLAGTCLDGDASAQLSSTPTPAAFYWPGKTTEHFRLSRFGMTCEPLMADRGEALLMWFLEASRARTLVLQGKEKGSLANDQDYGPKWRGWLAKFDPDTFSWRTAQQSFIEDSGEFLETFPTSGMTRDGLLWALPTLGRTTNETGFGLLPTPTTKPMGSNSHMRSRGTTTRKTYLEWEGPSARHYHPDSTTGSLNPDWVEWLMGWPIGWTELKPLETDRFRKWPQQHGPC